jgi:hypothetical protein
MKNNILNEELEKMKFMFGYQKGRVISEQMPSNSPTGFNLYTPFQAPTTQPSQQTSSQLEIPDLKDTRIFANYGCQAVNNNTMDIPPIASQVKFMKISGLNPQTTENKKIFCSFKLMRQKEAEINSLSQNPVTNRGENKPKITFKANDVFPIKFMDMGEKVKQLQTALGVVNKAGQPNISGKFYSTTEQKLVNKMNELGLKYDRNKGVDEETFNLIINPKNTQNTPVSPVTVDRKEVDLTIPKTAPKTLSTQAPTIQAPQTNQTDLPLEQQFELAKIELQKAKEGLDAAQQTRDRAQIGAARGVQQAARKKVQDLRAQLYPPQQ